jgi:AraC-like DNA-binding protein
MRPDDIEKAAAFIEEQLAGELDVAALAGALFVSPAQLYRDFYSEAGHSVKEYIRKRRLTRALALVKSSDMPLAAVAAECGYSSQQAFCKSVKAALGMTPLAYKNSDHIYFFPRFEGVGGCPVTVSAEAFPGLVRLDFYHPQARGIESRALGALNEALPAYAGRLFGRNGTQAGALFCYELFIERQANKPDALAARGFSGFAPAALSGGLFATTVIRNNDAAIGRAWDYLYNGWLKTSMFEQEDAPYFEEYIVRDGTVRRLRLFLPVKKREGYDALSLCSCGEMLFLVSRAAGLNAEEKAAGAVIGYLTSSAPLLLKETRRFYVAKSGGDSTCGVELEHPLPVPEDSGLFLLRVGGGDFAVLAGGCTGDSAAFESVLRAWVREAGYLEAGSPFTLYETDGGFGTQNVRTKVFIHVKK